MSKSEVKIFFWLIVFYFPKGNEMLICAPQNKTDSISALISKCSVDTQKINLLVQLCWEYQDIGQYETGLNFGYEGLSLANKINFKTGIADSYNRIAEIYRLQGNYNKALENHFAALKTSEEANYKTGIAKARKNIGVIYFHQKDYKKALEYHFISVSIFEKMKSPKGMSDCYNNIGMLYAAQKNNPEALKYYLRTISIKDSIGDRKGVAAARINIGIIFQADALTEMKNKNPGMAEQYFKEAESNFFLGLTISAGINYRKGVADAYTNLGNLFNDRTNPEKASEFFQKGLAIAENIGAKEYILNAYEGLTKLAEKRNDSKNAFLYYKKYIVYRDSLVNEENTKKLVQTQMQYDFDKKESRTNAEQEKKNLKANEEKRKQKIILSFIVSGLMAVVLLAGIIFRSLILNKRKNQIISEQKKIVEMQKNSVEEKQKAILDSILYAKRIQTALMANEKYFGKNLSRLQNKISE